jgi:hypothetical protein
VGGGDGEREKKKTPCGFLTLRTISEMWVKTSSPVVVLMLLRYASASSTDIAAISARKSSKLPQLFQLNFSVCLSMSLSLWMEDNLVYQWWL